MALKGLVSDYLDSDSENSSSEDAQDNMQTSALGVQISKPGGDIASKTSSAYNMNTDARAKEYIKLNADEISDDDDIHLQSSHIILDNHSAGDPTSTDSHSSDQSNSDSEQDSNKGDEEEKPDSGVLPNPFSSSILPSPSLSGSSSVEGSVFGNRFAQEEKAKLALYEKHVKMTEDKISSQAPCFKFRKGLCRKGDSCRFSHDVGFQGPIYNTNTEKVDYSHAVIEKTPFEKKKKIGVTNTLLPAKKARRGLEEQRTKERPWTVNK